MHTTYLRKKDEARGGDFESQSQRPSQSQYISSQFNNTITSIGVRPSFGLFNQTNGGGLDNTQFDASQNCSGSASNQDSLNNATIKVEEINLMELLHEANKDTFEQNKDSNKKKNGNDNVSKRKIQGTGQFCLTKSEHNASKREYQSTSETVNISNALRPKVNKKYNISPSVNKTQGGTGIAGFLGIKQEEAKQVMIKQEIVSEPKEQVEHKQSQEQNKASAVHSQQSAPVHHKEHKQNKKLIKIAEYASNLNMNDFFTQGNDQPMDDDLQNANTQSHSSELENKRKKQGNKKRKRNEISNNVQLSDEIDELDEEAQQVSKKRKLNNQFDQPLLPKKGINSSFMVNKKTMDQDRLKVPVQQKKQPQVQINSQQNIFGVKQELDENKNSRRQKCQLAFHEFFKENPQLDEYIVVKITCKVRKFGVSWCIGDMVDFKVKDLSVVSILKKNSKKIRIMMPVHTFNAFNYSNKQRDSHDRGSNSSHQGSFQVNDLMIVENPLILSQSLQGETQIKDDYYLTVMGKHMTKFEDSVLAAKPGAGLHLSQKSNQTV